tara:strand:+ start:501 stop:2240 length:1740 start_codon:yes stop_codon:yes gene_type:complete
MKKKNRKKPNTLGLSPVLFFIFLLGLFSESVKTLPVGAFSEKTNFYDIPKLSSEIFDDQLINNLSIVKKTSNNELENEETFSQKPQTFVTSKDIIENKTQDKFIKEDETKIVKLIESETNDSEIQIKNQEAPIEDIVNVEEIKETIKIAADTSTSTIVIDGEETLIPGSSEKNITYMQILQKPNDLDLNLKYAQQQGKIGNYKQTISTLERLNMLYPDNVEIKLYLLSVLVQADSPTKALTVIEEIKTSEDLTPEDLETVNEIETELKERGRPKLWNFYADIGIGGIQNNNVNSVSKSRRQISSDSVSGFNTAKYDRTISGSLGLTATRSLGEASSFMINMNVTDSNQEVETTDDYESYGLTLALDTTIGNQSLSPYLMLSKTDYQEDADSFSLMYGIGGNFPVGDRNSFSYGYSFSDSKNNNNTSDTTADDTNAIGHSFSLGHDFMFNEIISTSTGLGYSDSDAQEDTNDYETYDLSFRINLAFPWAYISIGDALSFNDYKRIDTSVSSNRIRSDVTNTFDVMFTKAIGDIFPTIDPNKNFFVNFSYEKVISEANIMNYDYIADSLSLSFSKAFQLNK